MGRMIFDLTDDDRAALERHRIGLGCRSHAETLRALIRREPLKLGGVPVYPDEAARLPDHDLAELHVPDGGNRPRLHILPHVDVQIGPTAPKPGSRLKVKK